MKSYRIPFDIAKLIVSIVLYLSIFTLLAAACLYISLDPLMIFLVLTICWFSLKALIRNVKRLIGRKPICVLDETGIQINSLTDNTKVMKWKEIQRVVYKQKHHSIQLLVYGNHVDHASGYYMIHIDYPFTAKKLDDVKKQVIGCFEKHHITIEYIEKGVNTHVSYSTKN